MHPVPSSTCQDLTLGRKVTSTAPKCHCLPRAHHRSHKSKSLLTSQSDSARDITYSKLWKSFFLQMSIATKPPFIYRRKWVCKGKCVHTGLHGWLCMFLRKQTPWCHSMRVHTHTHTLLTCLLTCKQCVCVHLCIFVCLLYTGCTDLTNTSAQSFLPLPIKSLS